MQMTGFLNSRDSRINKSHHNTRALVDSKKIFISQRNAGSPNSKEEGYN